MERSCNGFSGSPSRRIIVECRPQAELLPRGIALVPEEFPGEITLRVTNSRGNKLKGEIACPIQLSGTPIYRLSVVPLYSTAPHCQF